MPRLLIERLRFHGFGEVDLEIAPGECVSVSGPSGAGKTLLLRSIADLEPHEGRIRLDEIECAATPAPLWRQQVGLLPSESAWWGRTVGDHLDGCGAPPLRGWMRELGFADEVPGWTIPRLSTGERSRLALLRLLVHDPRALLLDEPTANLDPESTRRVEKLIAAYRESGEAPVLWVTHDPEQAARVATRHLEMPDCRLSAHGVSAGAR